MKHFRRIASGLNVAPALAEVGAKGTTRHEEDLAPAELANSLLSNPQGVRMVQWERFKDYPAVQSLWCDAMAALGPSWTPQRARVRILPPHSTMKPHKDSLHPFEARFQVAMQVDDEMFLSIKQERCRFKAGELWHIDIADRLHYARNNSYMPRAVLVLDMVKTGALDSTPVLRSSPTLREQVAETFALSGLTIPRALTFPVWSHG